MKTINNGVQTSAQNSELRRSPGWRSLLIAACTAGVCASASAQSTRPDALTETRWPRAQRIATGLDHPQGIASDGKFAYVVTGGFQGGDNAVKRIAADGGKVDTIAAGGGVTTGVIASDGTWVYWGGIAAGSSATAPGSGAGSALPQSAASLRAVPASGGNPVVLASLPSRPAAITLDDAYVYIMTSSRKPEFGTIVRAPKRGGTAMTVLSGYAGLSGMVVDNASIFFATPEGLYRASKDGALPTLILPGIRKAVHLAGDREYLYFFGEQSGGRWALFKLAKAGGQPVRLAANVQSNMDMALSDASVYFFEETRLTYAGQITAYALRRVAKSGGNVETVDLGEIPSGKLALVGERVLFTDINTVYLLPR